MSIQSLRTPYSKPWRPDRGEKKLFQRLWHQRLRNLCDRHARARYFVAPLAETWPGGQVLTFTRRATAMKAAKVLSKDWSKPCRVYDARGKNPKRLWSYPAS